MSLDGYRRKRRFGVTPEPKGRMRRPSRAKLRYVIQKHRASHLHYDFRLAWKGVLLSWAVPRGPSLSPSVKRLAVQVEDHPVEYADFEGVIPGGEYGGGTVMVWDTGSWEPEAADVDDALSRGELKFRLRGRKLKGEWVLVRTRLSDGKRKPSWLLIKHRDAKASAADVTSTAPRSALTRRTLAQIAAAGGGDVAAAAEGDPPPPGRRKRRA